MNKHSLYWIVGIDQGPGSRIMKDLGLMFKDKLLIAKSYVNEKARRQFKANIKIVLCFQYLKFYVIIFHTIHNITSILTLLFSISLWFRSRFEKIRIKLNENMITQSINIQNTKFVAETLNSSSSFSLHVSNRKLEKWNSFGHRRKIFWN